MHKPADFIVVTCLPKTFSFKRPDDYEALELFHLRSLIIAHQKVSPLIPVIVFANITKTGDAEDEAMQSDGDSSNDPVDVEDDEPGLEGDANPEAEEEAEVVHHDAAYDDRRIVDPIEAPFQDEFMPLKSVY